MEFGARAIPTAHIVIGGHWSHLRVTCYNDDSIYTNGNNNVIKINGRALPICASCSLRVYTENKFNEHKKIDKHCCALHASH